jgi:hypothetical protein
LRLSITDLQVIALSLTTYRIEEAGLFQRVKLTLFRHSRATSVSNNAVCEKQG